MTNLMTKKDAWHLRLCCIRGAKHRLVLCGTHEAVGAVVRFNGRKGPPRPEYAFGVPTSFRR